MIHAHACSTPTPPAQPAKPELRHAFGRFPTGIAVITMLDEHGAPYGLTVNSFTSVSMEPPILSWNVVRGTYAHASVSRAGRFAVNILAREQRGVAQQMTGPIASRFENVRYTPSESGLPLLDGALASFECALHGMVTVGDHDIILGAIENFRHCEGRPLVYWQGSYATAAHYDSEQ